MQKRAPGVITSPQRTQVGPVAMQLTVVGAQKVSKKRETRELEAPPSPD